MIKSSIIKRAVYLSLCLCFLIGTTNAQTDNIKNDIFWNTKDGQPIYSQGGGIFRFADPATGQKKYYWYGVHYLEAENYRNTPSVTQTHPMFQSVTCYSSTDLVNWTFVGDVLTKDEVNQSGRKTWVGRLGVAYISQLKKYAMFVQHGGHVLITVSDSPAGPFVWHQEISMEPMIGTTNTGDQTVFTDEDTGKSYLIYSYGRGRNKIYVSEIGVKDGKVNLLDCTQVFRGESREGNCMFKYNKRYYMCASNIYGWDASYAYFLVADNIRGPYTPANNMQVMDGCADDYAHVTQTGFFVTIKGSKQETVVYCGDRWCDFAGNGLGYNQWCPLSFDGKTPHFNSLSSWDMDAHTGKWKVAADNNYVKNGSFEADRRDIPSLVKPVQQQLTGWATTVIEGNAIEVGDANSPVLNHINSENDRKIVVGEKSLNISDKISFKRKVSQMIASSPDVKLEDGFYTLTARMKNSNGFTQLEMYAESNGKILKISIAGENAVWQTIRITNIPVRAGKVEIGFMAEGAANAFCYVDDVSLVKNQ
jgi:beta-xylosidase